MTDTYPTPTADDEEALSDAMWDLINNGYATLPPDEDPAKWIYWLKRYRSFYHVSVYRHDWIALILKGF